LFYSNLGLLGVALGIATGIVVDGCNFNFSTYQNYFTSTSTPRNVQRIASCLVRKPYAKTVYCARINSYTCLPERSSPKTKHPQLGPQRKSNRKKIPVASLPNGPPLFPTPGRFRADEAAIAALPSLAKADDPGEVPPSTSDGNPWKSTSVHIENYIMYSNIVEFPHRLV